ncbi:MAG TPA: hypothetical protein VGS59_06580 [Candidatus Acidoferrales bacterium]|nr:hypothetical protein [Candidatus Acidoferrales bacterium]
MSARECPFCGKRISEIYHAHRDCPHCHETLPERRIAAAGPNGRAAGSGRQTTFRRGLLYMMSVAFIYYLLSPQSPLRLPVPFAPLLTTYLLPCFFLMGLGFALYGIFQHVRG